jgi:hypothetical protein
MGSQDSFFEALGGETPTGFFTHSTSISIGVDVQGNQVGVKGTCQGPVGDGVQGFGSGNFSGVAGFGGGTDGTGVVGFGAGQRGTGIRGIGVHGPNTGPQEAAGVFGQGGPNSTGVIGQGGSGEADGVRGFGSENFSGVAGFGGSFDGTGVVGFGGGGFGTGVRGIGAGGPDTSRSEGIGVYGQGASFGFGVMGVHGPFVNPLQDVSAGVYGESNLHNTAGVMGATIADGIGVWGVGFTSGALAAQFDGPVLTHGDVNVNGNATVTGIKSAAVPFPDGSHRRLYCMESPENWFEDFGTGHLIDGQADVQLEPGFASVVKSDHYHVFLTEYDDNNALYVCDRTSHGFKVRAKSSKTARGTFSYRIVAKRKDIAGPRLEKVEFPTHKRPTLKIPKIVERPYQAPLPVQPGGSAAKPTSDEGEKR